MGLETRFLVAKEKQNWQDQPGVQEKQIIHILALKVPKASVDHPVRAWPDTYDFPELT
jgi:hypothetical protein